MNRSRKTSAAMLVTMVAALVIVGGAGYWLGSRHMSMPAPDAASDKTVLYWYDPMVPDKQFDKPGKSPFMDMQLVPKYADETEGDKAAMENMPMDGSAAPRERQP